MPGPTTVAELDLTPIPGKIYWNSVREWREEFIYFLLVDRFHDDRKRTPVQTSSRSLSQGTPEQLSTFCGGTLCGIVDHLDYIKNLGCTALWLSPIFENNAGSGNYHGYSIQNYLDIDPRFGTKQDLVDLVQAAHDRNMRVFLDVVINHSGDNWSYPGDYPYYYADGQQFPLGSWRKDDRPVPLELRDSQCYHRKGQIRNWDAYPEFQEGDFFALKDYYNDDDPVGDHVLDILIKAHCYWIREADIDGFRMDAAKHIGALAVSRFCQGVREYASSLDKHDFFLFGELIANDGVIDRYIGPNTSTTIDDKTVYFGLSSVLDFPLYWVLPSVIKGFGSPADLRQRYDALKDHALSRGELGRYFVTFLDNHDQVGQDYKRRFAADAPDAQVIAGIGYILCALGAACIYYGTEQGFAGQGPGDAYIREPLFDLQDQQRTYHNPDCTIYQEIAKIAHISQSNQALRFGRMYFRQVSGDGGTFDFPQSQPCTLAFARVLAYEEVLVAYNTSSTESRRDYVIVDSTLHKPGDTLTFLYGQGQPVIVQKHPDNSSLFVQLELAPMQFVILQ
ncbi:MAG TPA: alpha-amylase family glycosyl hydrolase [Ktedonobacteraceae bacterium]|nr:alpha-amylase family glycosyl hydrolase [Ktedonobacteraceae bacterium]